MVADNGGHDASVNERPDAQAQAGAGGQGQAELMSSFFPSPPSFYTHYTPQNIALAKKLTSHPSFVFYLKEQDQETSESAEQSDDWKYQQESILKELNIDDKTRESVENIDLRWLVKPPSAELIEEDGHWMAFGQAWPINEALPSLEEMGVRQLFKQPETFQDRRDALHSLLRTILHTYLRLLSVLLQGPPSIPSEQEQFKKDPSKLLTTQADQLIEHIKLCTINIHHICNEWRPVQARETIKLILRNQIDERKEIISEMKSACDDIKARLSSLQTHIRLNNDSMESEDLANRLQSAGLEDTPPQIQQENSKKEQARQRMLEALDALGE